MLTENMQKARCVSMRESSNYLGPAQHGHLIILFARLDKLFILVCMHLFTSLASFAEQLSKLVTTMDEKPLGGLLLVLLIFGIVIACIAGRAIFT